MPTQKFKYPLTETERNELITIFAAYEQMKLRDLAQIFDVQPPRIDRIIHATLQRLFPADERLCYLPAKTAIKEYAERLLQSKEISERLKQIVEKEKQLMAREFYIGETVLYARQNEIVVAVDGKTITLSNGSRVRRSSTNLEKVATKIQLEIPFPKKRKNTN